AALGRPAAAGGGRGAGGRAVAGGVDRRGAGAGAAAGGGDRVRVRGVAGGVRRDRVPGAARPADGAGGDLPAHLAPRGREPGDGSRRLGRAGGADGGGDGGRGAAARRVGRDVLTWWARCWS